MSVHVHGELGKITGFSGAVGGVLSAIESPAFKGDFIGHLMTELRQVFMTDSMAAGESGAANIKHMFEWGEEQGEISNKPLFALTSKGKGGTRYLTYKFLPSKKYVPLPDPARYGIDPSKVAHLNRHIFRFKAIVMETDSAVEIAPRGENRLFIPDERAERGYYMTNKPQLINSGGMAATGGFTSWWTTWFDTRAQGYVKSEANRAAEFIKKSGQTVIRDATTGRFSKGHSVSIGYADAVQRTAKLKVLAMAEDYFPEDEF